MDKKIRFEITSDGKIYAKTIGMDDESCLDYVEIMENILDAKAVDSSYTEEFLLAQNKETSKEHIAEKQRLRLKGE